jgi:putative membrane protein
VTSGLPERAWARLHPLSPLLILGRAVLVVLAVVLPRLTLPLGPPGGHVPWGDLVVLALLGVAGLVTWLVTRWRVTDGELQIETGLFRRQSIRVPLTRIQAIDVVRPLLARVLGLAELRVVVAGSGANRTRLAYLGEDRALAVRAELLALAHGLHRQAGEAPERPVLAVPLGRLVASVVLSLGTVVFATVLVATAVAGAVTGRPLLVLAAAWPTVFAAGAVALRRVTAEFGFTVADAPDGLRVRSGLLLHRAETIPRGRVQAVRWIEPLFWRPFGWCRLEVDVARQRNARRDRDEGRLTDALLPVGPREDAARLLAAVLPGAVVLPPPRARPPRRARWRAPLSYRNLRFWYDDAHACGRTGRLQRRLTVVPLEKVQSLREVQGPLSRLLRLATLRADTAGRGWQAVGHARDAAESRVWLWDLTDRARERRHLAHPSSAARP